MTPTREQVVHLGRKAGIFPESKFLMPYDYIIDAQTKFATLARADLEATIAEQEQSLQNLCARIHRDGGHYAAEHGLSKAILDADIVVTNAFGTIEEQAAEIERIEAKLDENAMPDDYILISDQLASERLEKNRLREAERDCSGLARENAALKAELAGEKAAALNYRADAIEAEKQRDDANARAAEMEQRYDQLTLDLKRIVEHRDELMNVANAIYDIRELDSNDVPLEEAWPKLFSDLKLCIASAKSDHFRDSAKMVEDCADTLADIDDSFVRRVDDAITEALGDAMDCTRVWSAWRCGTMGEDDFVRVADDQGRVIEIRDAVLKVVSHTKEGGA